MSHLPQLLGWICAALGFPKWSQFASGQCVRLWRIQALRLRYDPKLVIPRPVDRTLGVDLLEKSRSQTVVRVFPTITGDEDDCVECKSSPVVDLNKLFIFRNKTRL